jgi:hypothetical protein
MWDRVPSSQRIAIRSRVTAGGEAGLSLPVHSSRSPTSADGRVGGRIREVRSKLGLTQKQVASRVAMSGDLSEIVELYSSLRDPRRRGAIVAYARSLAGPFQSF